MRFPDRVPRIAAAATFVAGAVNVLSVMTPELPLRMRELLAFAPMGELRIAHALALPAGLALAGAAVPLARRRRRALLAAIALLALLAVLNLLKGLDVEEAVVSGGLAVALWRSREAFWVGHERVAPATLARRVALMAGGAWLAAAGAVAVAATTRHARPALGLADVPAAALHAVTLTGGPHYTGHLTWLRLGLAMLGIGAGAAIAATLLEPLRPRQLGGALDRHRAAALVRRHGTDTLSAFKLRRDLQRIWSEDGRALAAFRIEAGSMLLAGDPVGPPETMPGMLDEALTWARRHGLGLGVLGASEGFAELGRAAGMRALYLGDEAMVATGAMDLGGGRRKSLRKAVNRVARHGFTAQLQTVGELDGATLRQLQAVSDAWRDGVPERGFSMAHDALVDELLPDALVVLARDAGGHVRGFLHFVPVFGCRAVSLGFMRRERDTPNGLMDFLVVEAARLLGERGIEEFSLNFATGGRWLREPANVVERALARTLSAADRWLQIERLLRFNAKFEPRWQPRYLLFESAAQLPRVALASMWAEGQLPRLPWPRRARRGTHVPALPAAARR